MRSWPTVLAAAALTVSLTGSLTACGDDDSEPSADGTPTASSSPTPSEATTDPPTPDEEDRIVVTISIEGDRIAPGGDRLEVAGGETVVLEITSDRAGELHVHSKPEQFVEFEAGASTHELVISAPGVVDVEEHESGHVVVQLEVR